MSAKRILSGLLALVLLLGNVPVTALATDTLPEETLTVLAEETAETAAAETTALVTEPETEAPTEEETVPTEAVTEAPTEAPETTAETEPAVVETTVATEPVVVETTVATEPVVVETTGATEPVVVETTEETEPVVVETTEETEPVVIETTAETEPVIPETEAPTEPAVEETLPEETVEATEEIIEEVANAITGTCGTNVTWSYDEDTCTLTISGEGAMSSYSSSNRPWEDYEDSIQTVVIEEGVTSIGNYSFYYCDSLTTVTIGEGVTSIGNYAFYDCDVLSSVTLPATITSIGTYAFRYCSSQVDIYYGGNYDQWEAISGRSYAQYSGITVHKVPAGSLGDNHSWAFDAATGTLTISGEGKIPNISYYSSSPTEYDHPWVDFVDSITAVVLEEGVTAIGNYAFYKHTALKTVTFAETVTEIGSYAFAYCNAFTEITIPGTITSLYTYAFYNCDALRTVTLKEGVESISSCAFAYCDTLEEVKLPVSLLSIGSDVFYYCNSLTDIYYAGNYTQWEAIDGHYYAEYTNATIHKAPTGTLGDNLFWSFDETTNTLTISGEGTMNSYSSNNNRPWEDYKDSIQIIIVENGVTSIGDYAFYQHTALKSITFADTVTEIGSYAFAYCNAFTEITIPGSITSLYSFAFYNCDALRTVTLKEGVESISSYAFAYCDTLEEVKLPVSLVSIGNYAFRDCTVLTDIYYAGDYSQWEAISGYSNAQASGRTVHKTPKGACGDEATWVFDKETGTLTISGKGETYGWGSNSYSPTKYNHPWKDFAGSITKVVVKEGITALGQYAFNNHTALKSVTLPKSLTTLYSCAFSWCESLNEIVIPEGVTTIYSSAFSNCTSLKSVTIPATVTELYWNAFNGCTALTDIYYGSTKSAWENLGCADEEPCASATLHTTPAGICGENLTWKFNESTGVLTIQGKGAMYDYGDWTYGERAPWFDYVEKIKSVTVKSGVTTIGNDAFGVYNYNDPNYKRLTKVTLPSTLTSIGADAFGNCPALASITIPDKVTSIGNYAFQNCTSLASVTIPDSVTTLGQRAFSGCTALTSLTLSKKLTTIPNSAFSNCDKLRSITIPAAVTEIAANAFYSCDKLDTVKLSKGLKAIGAYAFQSCARLANISIPASVTSIGEGAFYGCQAITKVTIPAGITTIEPSTFYSCGITQITIPESVTTIGNNAFCYTALTSVTVPATVTSLGEGVFADCNSLTTATLPKGMTAIPKSTFSWCNRLAKITIPSTVTEIGAYAFSNCDGLVSITLPTKLTTISEAAFQDCDGLQKIVIPKNVDLIDYRAFASCNNLKVIHFKGNAPDMYSDTFQDVTADAIYPRKNSTWNSGARQNYGGTITWTVSYPLNVTPRISDGKPKLTWGKVTGASKYYVYRSTRANGGFKKIKTTTSTSFTNSGAAFGKTYYYKVTTVFTDGTTATSRVVSCNSVLPAPKITVTKNNNGNPVIKWKAVDGADYYEIRRLTEDGYHSMGTGTNKRSYVDTDAEAGVTYRYQVLAYPEYPYNSDFRSQYCEPVTFTVPLEKPAITLSSVASSGKIKISWSAIPYAEKYQVYRATSKTGTYKRIATTTGTSLTNANAEAGKTYYYKVRAIHKDTSANSPFSAIKSRMCDLPAPVITVELNASGKPRTSWAKVDGAVKYQVWRATSKNGKYTCLTTTTNLYQVNKNAVAGTTYYYKVRAVYSNTNANSAFSTIKSITAK